MYPKRAFNVREQDYSALLRYKLEEAERVLQKLNPSRERSLALTKLDEALLWANVAIASGGIDKDWRAGDEWNPVYGCALKVADEPISNPAPINLAMRRAICCMADDIRKQEKEFQDAVSNTDDTITEV